MQNIDVKNTELNQEKIELKNLNEEITGFHEDVNEILKNVKTLDRKVFISKGWEQDIMFSVRYKNKTYEFLPQFNESYKLITFEVSLNKQHKKISARDYNWDNARGNTRADENATIWWLRKLAKSYEEQKNKKKLPLALWDEDKEILQKLLPLDAKVK